jgi:transcriptional regulator with XRE-family HTH domain
MGLGAEIKKARADKQWKQQDLQAATGISQTYLSKIECGKADPSFSVVQRIATALEVSLDQLGKNEKEAEHRPAAVACDVLLKQD